jgi:excisionase family DNA binding protein
MDIGTYMAEAQYSLAEVAKITGKSEKTISRWIKSGKLPAIRHGTGYLISEDDIPLRVDPNLDRHTFIQQRLMSPDGFDVPPANHSSDSRRVDIHELMGVAGLIAGGQADRKGSLDNINMMFQKHQAEVEKIIREQNELAEKYARATYKIGQLEERNRLLEEQNLKLEQKMGLLPPPEQWNSTRQELDRIRETLQGSEKSQAQKDRELESLRSQIDSERRRSELVESDKRRLEEKHQSVEIEYQQTKDALEAERKKSFWKRLFGG